MLPWAHWHESAGERLFSWPNGWSRTDDQRKRGTNGEEEVKETTQLVGGNLCDVDEIEIIELKSSDRNRSK